MLVNVTLLFFFLFFIFSGVSVLNVPLMVLLHRNAAAAAVVLFFHLVQSHWMVLCHHVVLSFTHTQTDKPFFFLLTQQHS